MFVNCVTFTFSQLEQTSDFYVHKCTVPTTWLLSTSDKVCRMCRLWEADLRWKSRFRQWKICRVVEGRPAWGRNSLSRPNPRHYCYYYYYHHNHHHHHHLRRGFTRSDRTFVKDMLLVQMNDWQLTMALRRPTLKGTVVTVCITTCRIESSAFTRLYIPYDSYHKQRLITYTIFINWSF